METSNSNSLAARTKVWIVVILSTLVTFFICLYYYGLTKEGAQGDRLLSQVTADVSMLIIGFSFMLSSLAYFWPSVFQKLLRFRQHIGLAGFYIFLIHFYFAFKGSLDNPARAFADYNRVWSFTLGVVGTVIFFFMALISNNTALKMLGSRAFRIILRTGYVAYILVIIHYAIRKLDEWQMFFNRELPLPPLSLVVTVFAFAVILMRVILYMKLRTKKATVVTTTNNL